MAMEVGLALLYFNQMIFQIFSFFEANIFSFFMEAKIYFEVYLTIFGICYKYSYRFMMK